MQSYHYLMAGAALLAGVAAFRRPRALLWIAILAASYAVSVRYLLNYEAIEAGNVLTVYSGEGEGYVALAREWLPPSIVAAMCDITAAAVIRFFGQERWEVKWLAGAVFVMAALNIVYSSGVIFGFPPIPEQWVLGVVLEAINIMALLLIVTGGTGIVDWILDFVDWINERMGVRRGRGRLLDRCLTYLRTPSKTPLWHK